MSNRYPIPAARHRVEEEIRRSRFITTVAHTPSVEAARAFISEMRAEFGDASHNCWAYVAGPPGDSAQIGMSDDGEPHGTAGKPMLTVLLHSGIGEVSAVVTRYFGGVLLGKGGLVRAYRGGVQLVLASMPVAEHVPSATIVVLIGYAAITPLQRILAEFEVETLDEEYTVDVTYRFKMPLERVGPFSAALNDLTNGDALIEETARDKV